MKMYDKICLSNLSINKEMRSDLKFYNWCNKNTLSFSKSMRLKDFILEYYKGYAFESDDFQNIGEVYVIKGINFTEFLTINEENLDYLSNDFYIDPRFNKFKIRKKDVLVSLVGSIGKIAIINNDIIALLNQNNIGLRFKNKFNHKVYAYILKFVLDDMIKMLFEESGYSFLRVDDLLNIQLPILNEYEQNYIYKIITNSEQEICNKLLTLKSSHYIIDEMMQNFFKFDYTKFETLKKNIFYSSFSQYGNNKDTRFSSRFHRPAGEFVYQELLNKPSKKIKNSLILPMITGQGIETNDYDESGDYAYISMAEISSWKLDLSDIKYVSNEYANKKLTKKLKGLTTPVSTEIGVNDILMMRSGEGGIGKVAIIENNIKGIFCDFIIRMRFNESIVNPYFAYYFFRSKYFQYLIEINKKGLGNNTNIFPNQVQEFPIPDISLSEQQQIIDNIKTELNKQDMIQLQISYKKSEIEQTLLKIFKIPKI